MFLRKRRPAPADPAAALRGGLPRFLPGDAVVIVGGGWRLAQYQNALGVVIDTLSPTDESVVLLSDGRRRRFDNRSLVRQSSVRP